MPFTVVKRRFFVALLLIAVSTFFFASYLSYREELSIFDTTDSFPLPDVQHPVVKISCLRYLGQMERGKAGPYVAYLKSHGKVDDRNCTIVLRHRSNTSKILQPTPDAGRLSAIFMGRTGNRMYIYAGLYGIARRNGMHHVISANNPLLKLFHLNVTVVQSDRPGRDWVQFVPTYGKYDNHTEYLDPRVDVELVGILKPWKYYGLVMSDLLQNHFRFREAIQQEADSFLRHSMAQFDVTPSDVVLIAVHIRRTDRVTMYVNDGHEHMIPDRAYFSHAVAFFNRLFDNKTMYVVCSDDLKWSKMNFEAKRPTVFSVGHSADVDFAILSRCNHSLLSIGSFGIWSAYMAGGVTVYHNARAPTVVPLEVAFRKVDSTEFPQHAWITLS